jgi:hypothetical protein
MTNSFILQEAEGARKGDKEARQRQRERGAGPKLVMIAIDHNNL